MATRRVEIGPTGDAVRANIARVRTDQRITLRQLADRLKESDRPLSYTTLSQIENGARRVDVDDLMALALALDVSPGALMVPLAEPSERIDVTGLKEVTSERVWQFIEGYWSPNSTGLGFIVRSRPQLARATSVPADGSWVSGFGELAVERKVRVDKNGVRGRMTIGNLPEEKGSDGDD